MEIIYFVSEEFSLSSDERTMKIKYLFASDCIVTNIIIFLLSTITYVLDDAFIYVNKTSFIASYKL